MRLEERDLTCFDTPDRLNAVERNADTIVAAEQPPHDDLFDLVLPELRAVPLHGTTA